MTIPAIGDWKEDQPANTDFVGEGDDEFRLMKTQVRQVIEVDHKFESDGKDPDNGRHKIIRLLQQIIPTQITDQGQLYVKDLAADVTELFYLDEVGNETQLTDAGRLVGANTGTFGVGSATGNGLGYGTDSVVFSDTPDSFTEAGPLTCSVIVKAGDIIKVTLQGRMEISGQVDVGVELRPKLTVGTATQILGIDGGLFFWATNDDVNQIVSGESGASYNVSRLYKATLDETLTFKMEWRRTVTETLFTAGRIIMAERIARDA